MHLAENEGNKKNGGDVKTDNSGNSNKGTSSKAMSIVIIVLLVILVAVGVVIAYKLLTGDENDGSGGSGSGLVSRDILETRDVIGGTGAVLTPENYQSILSEFREPDPDTRYTVSTSAYFRFDKNGVALESTFVGNHEDNHRTVYFDLFLKGTGDEPDELLYSSPYITVGAEVRDFTLSRALPEGEHDVRIVYHLVDDENEYADVTTLSMSETLIVT